MSNPQLSIVIAVRNDNYGGDFTHRLQACIDWNTKWLEHYGIATEFVLVNWNPVQENESLSKLIRWPVERKRVFYRIVDVSNDVHNKYVNPEIRKTVPMFEFIAKNAGIRRAQGASILCINADILLHPSVIEMLASQEVKTDNYYRANRLDFKKVDHVSLSSLWGAGFAISLKGFMYRFVPVVGKRLQYYLFQRLNTLRLSWELLKLKHSGVANAFRLNVVYNNGAYHAHCLNSGDFMLMERDNWMRLKGYPEYTAISTHTDALFTVLAHRILKEVVVADPVFHQEHERRYSWDAIQQGEGFQETYLLFEETAAALRSGAAVDEFLNSDEWGLEGIHLNEQRI